jgi:catechol 2,3-dioxygenase-like lactoylglutathione lyase family enzyme
MPKIRHLAIIAMNPEKLAKFYSEVFEMKIVNRNRNLGSVFLSDGYMNLAIIPNRGEGKVSGLNHFGFHIEDSELIEKRMKKWDVRQPAGRPDNRAYAELRGTDPEGNTFDICQHDFQQAKNGDAATKPQATKRKKLAKVGA